MRYQQQVVFARPRVEMGNYMRHNFRDLYPGLGRQRMSGGPLDEPVELQQPAVTSLELGAGIVGLLVSLLGAVVVRSEHEGLGNMVTGIGGAVMGAAIFMNINRRNSS